MYEYKVVPAPKRGLKSKGVRGTEARFANALEKIMNDHAKSGWEYQRTDTLPSEEREGLMGRATVYQNLLVFRRTIDQDVEVQPAEDDVKAATEVKEEDTPPVEEPAAKPEPVKEPEVQTKEEIAKVEVSEVKDALDEIDLTNIKSERV